MKEVKYYPALNFAINEANYYKSNSSAIIVASKNLLTIEDENNIKLNFKKFVYTNILDFIVWCRKEYGEKVIVYRVKKYLMNKGRQTLYPYDFVYQDSYYQTDALYGFNNPDKIPIIEKWIQDISIVIPLSEKFERRN